jgi:hypothetical protein
VNIGKQEGVFPEEQTMEKRTLITKEVERQLEECTLLLAEPSGINGCPILLNDKQKTIGVQVIGSNR